jgi:hypothetical protein
MNGIGHFKPKYVLVLHSIQKDRDSIDFQLSFRSKRPVSDLSSMLSRSQDHLRSRVR